MTRQLLLNPRKRVKLDNGRTACTSAEEDEAVPRPNRPIAQASGLAAPVDDDDDLLQDVIERQHGAFTPSKSIAKHFMIFITEVDRGGRPIRPLWLGHRHRCSVNFRGQAILPEK